MPSEQLETLGQHLSSQLKDMLGPEAVSKVFNFFRLPQDFGCFVDLKGRRFWLHLSETAVGPSGPEPSDPYAWMQARPSSKAKAKRKSAGRPPKDEVLI